eukprot:361775-Chlamydomonas_euryale.AAC.11
MAARHIRGGAALLPRKRVRAGRRLHAPGAGMVVLAEPTRIAATQPHSTDCQMGDPTSCTARRAYTQTGSACLPLSRAMRDGGGVRPDTHGEALVSLRVDNPAHALHVGRCMQNKNGACMLGKGQPRRACAAQHACLHML